MTVIDEFNQNPCNKIPASCVDAYLDISLKDNDPATLVLDSSWGTDELDLTPAVKAGETQTTLKLSPDTNPVYLEYIGEDGEPQCIHGDDLARIIPMTKLKDVSQSMPIGNGKVYMYNSNTKTFEPYDLKSFVDATNAVLAGLQGNLTNLTNALTSIQSSINNLTTRVNNLESRMSAIEALMVKPTGAPADAKLAWGNINVYGDYANTGSKAKGLYTHATSTKVSGDQIFA